MNDSLLTALIGFGGSLVGALVAFGATAYTLNHTEKAERARRAEERQVEHERELKGAYVEWLHSAHRKLNTAIELMHTVHDLNQEPPDLLKEVQSDPVFMGARIDLLEPDAEARRRLREAVKTFGRKIDTILTTPSPAIKQNAADTVSLAFRDLRNWLVDVRFVAGYVIQRQLPSKGAAAESDAKKSGTEASPEG